MIIFALPRRIKNNPYLDLLYAAVERDPSFAVWQFSFAKIFRALFRRERVVVHIHWESNLYGSRWVLLSLLRMLYKFPLLFLARLLGAKIIWTLHNLASHDYPHPALDALGRSCMWALAQAVIVQNKKIAGEMRAAHPGKKVVYIPHGNYIGVYGPALPPQPHEGVTLLSLGAIRPYKNLEALIAASEAAAIKLIIAGKGEPEYVARLQALAGPNVTIDNRFIPDAEVPGYFAAADYCVFAYGESSLTSGAVILALSYSVPVIATAMPAAELIHDGLNGFVVEDEKELAALLAHPPPPPAQVINTVAGDTWERVGAETRRLYSELV